MNSLNIDSLDWDKGNGLVPAIIQDADDGRVLMLGYMNRAALARTLQDGRVTFWSRTRQCLWTKGESSGHGLRVVDIATDCDRDTLRIAATPAGPVCHTGAADCFVDQRPSRATTLSFLNTLEGIIENRLMADSDQSYTATLARSGALRIAQKVGEEGLEVALAAVGRDDAGVVAESADLLFHLMVLLKSRQLSLADVVAALALRHRASDAPVT